MLPGYLLSPTGPNPTTAVRPGPAYCLNPLKSFSAVLVFLYLRTLLRVYRLGQEGVGRQIIKLEVGQSTLLNNSNFAVKHEKVKLCELRHFLFSHGRIPKGKLVPGPEMKTQPNSSPFFI